MIILQNFVEAVGLKRFIITDRLNFGELQGEFQQKLVTAESTKKYTNQVNQALSSCYFSVFSENCERGISTIL